MSAKATFWAWEQDVPNAQFRCVLLCLADCHNGNTGQCNPSVAYISKKTKCDRKTIMKVISALAESNLLRVVKSAGTSNSYSLNLESTYSIKQSHIVYRTTDPDTGEYYIGLHSTFNADDGYLGSGRWVMYHKDKDRLIKEILFSCDTRSDAADKEVGVINRHIDDPLCMNKSQARQNDNKRTTEKYGSIGKSSTNEGSTNGGSTNGGTAQQRDTPSTNGGTPPVPPVVHEPTSNLKVNLQDIYKKIELTNLTEEIDRETARELIDHRVNIKKPFTQQSFDRLIKKILKVKSDQEITLTPNQAIETIVDRGWQGFELDWLKSKEQKTAPQPTKRKPLPRPED